MELEPRDSEPDVDERDVPSGRQVGGLVDLTPTSAIVGIVVNSPVGSCTIVYPDFGVAVRDTWACGLEDGFVDNEVRAGRRAFKALFDRWHQEGYTPDMGEELQRLSVMYCSGYEVTDVSVLPDDLEHVLQGWWGDPNCDDYFADLVDAGMPIPEFDFSNPEHYAMLEHRLNMLAEA